MEEAGTEETKTRRYGLRSRWNVNTKPPSGGEGERGTGASATRQVLKDETARVVNVARTRKTTRNTRNKAKTGPREEVEAVVQETTENTVGLDEVVEVESSENVPTQFEQKVEEPVEELKSLKQPGEEIEVNTFAKENIGSP